MPRKPLYFNTDMPHGTNLDTIASRMGAYREATGVTFDEASILTPNSWCAEDAARYLREAGWSEFNRAEDVVDVEPFGTRYSVNYMFLNHPEVGYRMEVMWPGEQGGYSPLHAALWLPHRMENGWTQQYGVRLFPMPHFSYKPQGDYIDEMLRLTELEMGLAQMCKSTYGEFSYWHSPAVVDEQVYLKPRVNLRDAK